VRIGVEAEAGAIVEAGVEAEAIVEVGVEAEAIRAVGVEAIRAGETAIEKAELLDFSSSRSDSHTLAALSRTF
jgi:hypothetical protein